MTDQPIDSDDQIVYDILPARTDELAVPVALTIQPWHRPRKQFIREHQWAHFVRRLITKQLGQPGLQLPHESPEVRYLTLPGIDYLDARLIGELCNELGCELTATGFLAGDERNPHIARANMREDALIKSGYITDRSYTLPRPFEELADLNGQAFQQIKRRGPFHVVNVDACGSVAPPTADHARRLIDAIHRVLAFQFTYKSGPWLLFLTTDAQPESVAPETVRDLWATVESNASDDGDFRDEVLSIFGISGDHDVASVRHSVSKAGQEFLKVFSLGFGKWALHLARKMHRRMKAHSAYCYSTTPEGDATPTMACLAFEFRPQSPVDPDPFGVARTGQQAGQEADGQPSDSLRVAMKVGEMDNLDLKMQNQPLREQMASRTQVSTRRGRVSSRHPRAGVIVEFQSFGFRAELLTRRPPCKSLST